MKRYDAVFLHPPAIYDFRERPTFPGPIAYTVTESTEQFIIPPIGMLSIAEYLDRHGYRVVVENIGERMVQDKNFDVEGHIKGIEGSVYAIDLHWCVHAQGAIELAKLCKRLHPDSVIVLGGLTATRFHEEIIRKYEFVDVVIRGEAEKTFLELMNALDRGQKNMSVGNATLRVNGRPVVGPSAAPSESIDEFDFTRLDLLVPKSILFSKSRPPYCAHWSIPVCRGCVENCVTCGGSAYACARLLGRSRPSFRRPERIMEDLERLAEQGVKAVFLFQDPRMGGKRYWESLLSTLRKNGLPIDHLTLELFRPADAEYVKALAGLGVSVTLTISPESGVDHVRMAHGRNYTNAELIKTIEVCQENRVPLLVFFMLALAEDNYDTVKETWKLWEKICMMDQEARSEEYPITVNYGFGPMILLDPGSLAFDNPSSYGYRMLSNTLEGHIKQMEQPSWHQWINYETKYLRRDEIAKLILDTVEYSISLREKYGIYDRTTAFVEKFCYVDLSRLIMKEVDKIAELKDEKEKDTRLRLLQDKVREYFTKLGERAHAL
ncbi:MAG: hypothetical protein B9J98_06750 [Candidatus Terraquivivens tikiterensis]|uniref:B12-binding domain-containing protein n=1 Tax=Candidatus Terraquivivens tikiterensis TaxID=1980982 RepID=A0A2R7Y1Y7_9ARCH|nr:MAG: hypothetical protein B9J98_06750 [Candidatus Terraquivivens tikiterensis]